MIAPVQRAHDVENSHPAGVIAAAHDRGLMDVAFPPELGGRGLSLLHVAVGGEELAAVCAPTAFAMGFNHGALRPVVRAGTAEQRQR